jgi:hypothetical protein
MAQLSDSVQRLKFKLTPLFHTHMEQDGDTAERWN